jgi:hypothetical protein
MSAVTVTAAATTHIDTDICSDSDRCVESALHT